MSRALGPCMCGATDCPSCGPAQGYAVVKRWNGKRYVYVNPEDGDDGEPDCEPDYFNEPDSYADDAASDRYQRDIERNYP